MTSSFISSALRVLHIEQQAIANLVTHIDDNFAIACERILACEGKVVVCGMGKSGHIGNKIAATLASTGTPSFFMHPGEASHGDLGMLSKQDILLAISNSGETNELLALLPVIKRLGIPLIAMSGNPESSLARYADVHLCIKVEQEACSLGLAPTSSTTATVVMGDALAVALLDARGFSEDDFALSHPGGSLGKKLLLRLEELMHKGERLPCVTAEKTIIDALMEISSKGLGMTAIVDQQGKLAGIFTDGDLRRVLDARVDVYQTPIGEVMTRKCKTAHPDMLAAEALNLMETFKISGLIVVDESNTPVGALNMHDLLQAGIA
ncbi:KpsF/GutQ family sugar-phosphate isomerase [Bowmanella sp. JS7-9]|uniref:Arabinose 5-phosphate isomerase n=1 Tax=Pseudobowmanella zhangzhouensis TaxID=1537679 RepID=A0ABW1XM22_9ALTE|nr:KpsF/GutQ family sugar-phosphate isomerase [Bowmanella sp. JS7-9]TBX21841.1 D-arabinose 5-phosphate isomerase [Bowmanella sp. JS7-9]